jgi:uncharacterized membrane protein YgcG
VTHGQDLPDPEELTEVAAIPSAEELDETDRTLDLLAAGGAPTVSDPATDLLRAAAMPGEDAELTGAAAFTAALNQAVAESSAPSEEPPREPRTFTVLGRVIAAKVAIVAAAATIGVAGAAAATGAVLRAVDDPPPATTTSEPARPEGAAADLAGAPRSSSLAGERADENASELSVVAATARRSMCDAASTEPGAVALVDAALEAGTTTAEYCEQATATLDAARQDAGTTSPASDASDAADDPSDNAGPSAGTDPTGNGATNGNSPNAGGTPAGGAPSSGGSSGGTGNNGSPTPNTNANPNAAGNNSGGNATPNTNANPNAASDNSRGNATPNTNAQAADTAAARPVTPQANANANANANGRARPGAAGKAPAATPGTAATTRGPRV